MGAAYVAARGRIARLEADVRAQAQQVGQLRDALAQVQPPRRNKLYDRAERDFNFATSQSLLRLRALRAQINEEFDVIGRLMHDTPKDKP